MVQKMQSIEVQHSEVHHSVGGVPNTKVEMKKDEQHMYLSRCHGAEARRCMENARIYMVRKLPHIVLTRSLGGVPNTKEEMTKDEENRAHYSISL